MNDQNIKICEIKLKETIQQIQSLILMLETIGSTHPQYFQLGALNEKLQENTKRLNKLSENKDSLKSEIQDD